MPRTKAAVEVEELEDDDLELEEADEVEDEAPAPKAKAKSTRKAPAAKEGNGIAWLVDYVNEATDKTVTPAGLRTLLRRMARDEDGPVSREVGSERTRYSFTGERDPIVRAIVKQVKGGALDAKRGGGDNLAAARAAKKAKAESVSSDTPAPKRSRKAATEETPAAPVKATRRRKDA